jgi:RHS repeat-associated protein
VANFTYQWDSIGRLRYRKDTNQSYTEHFCYDDLNRVQNYALGTDCTGSGGVTVAYDDIGNIAEKTDICSTANCFVYGENGAGPHALTSIVGTYNGVTNPTFAYDANGNMTAGAGRTFSYTSFNMAAEMSQGSAGVGLAYGAWHGRYKMCAPDCAAPVTTTYYLYDPATGGMSEKVNSALNGTWRDYVIAPGVGIVAVRTQSGPTVTWRYVTADHLGSVSVLTDASGAVSERDGYDAWGKRRNADGTPAACGAVASQLTRGYTAQEMLDSLCLINMNARVQDPSLGRFASADAFVPNPLFSQSYNRYAYVANDPLNSIDPSGNVDLCSIDPAECKFIVFIGGADYYYAGYGDAYYTPPLPDACGTASCSSGGGWLEVPFELGCGAGCGGYELGGAGERGSIRGGTAVETRAQEQGVETVVVTGKKMCIGGLVTVGNVLEYLSAKTGQASGGVALGGLGVWGAGVASGQEELQIAGIGVIDASAYGGIAAGALQIGGGVLQGLGGAGWTNVENGFWTMGLSLGLSQAAEIAQSGNSVSARAANAFIKKSKTITGLGYDSLINLLSSIGPQQRSCQTAGG